MSCKHTSQIKEAPTEDGYIFGSLKYNTLEGVNLQSDVDRPDNIVWNCPYEPMSDKKYCPLHSKGEEVVEDDLRTLTKNSENIELIGLDAKSIELYSSDKDYIFIGGNKDLNIDSRSNSFQGDLQFHEVEMNTIFLKNSTFEKSFSLDSGRVSDFCAYDCVFNKFYKENPFDISFKLKQKDSIISRCALIGEFNLVTFKNCEFSGKANFEEAVFKAKSTFEDCEFEGDTYFASRDDSDFIVNEGHSTEFNGDTSFSGSDFLGRIYFSNGGHKAKFKGNIDFSHAFFGHKRSNLQNIKFSPHSDIKGRNIDFENCVFNNCDLRNCDFRFTNIVNMSINDESTIERAEFLGSPDANKFFIFSSLPPNKNTYHEDIRFKEVHANSKIGKLITKIGRRTSLSVPQRILFEYSESETPLENAREVKNVYNFIERIGRKFNRDDLRIKGKVYGKDMEKDAHRLRENYFRWVALRFSRATTLYGNSPRRYLFANLLIILLCGVIYNQTMDKSIFESMSYSILVFSRFTNDMFTLIQYIESLIGLIFVPFFVFLLGRRYTR